MFVKFKKIGYSQYILCNNDHFVRVSPRKNRNLEEKRETIRRISTILCLNIRDVSISAWYQFFQTRREQVYGIQVYASSLHVGDTRSRTLPD